jgi:hypothetical protein
LAFGRNKSWINSAWLGCVIGPISTPTLAGAPALAMLATIAVLAWRLLVAVLQLLIATVCALAVPLIGMPIVGLLGFVDVAQPETGQDDEGKM